MRSTASGVSMLFLLACGGGGSSGSSSGTGNLSSSTTGSGSAVTTTTTTSSDSQPGPELGVCGRLINCATALQQPLSGFVGMYGENGTCWDDFEPSVCWADCRATIRGFKESSPDTVECLECESDVDCGFWEQTPACDHTNTCAESAPCLSWETKIRECCEEFADQGLCPAVLGGDGEDELFECPAANVECVEEGEQSMACALNLGCSDFLIWYHDCHRTPGRCGDGGDGGGFVSDPDPYGGACLEETRSFQSCSDDNGGTSSGSGGY